MNDFEYLYTMLYWKQKYLQQSIGTYTGTKQKQ